MSISVKTLELPCGIIKIESGKIARQASGAALVTLGETTVLAASCVGQPRDNQDFFPLTVDYREKTPAAGKFPGGYRKREGAPTQKEILTARLVDRSIRPLFPDGYYNEVQTMVGVYSADPGLDPDVLSITAASASLHLSEIPFISPVAAVRVGQVNGEFVLFPTYKQREEGEMDLVVAGTSQAITMVESGARELPEARMIEAIRWAHSHIQKLVAVLEEMRREIGKPKAAFVPALLDENWYREFRSALGSRVRNALLTQGKLARGAAVRKIWDETVEKDKATLGGVEKKERESLIRIRHGFERLERELLRELILEGRRLDGRAMDEIRPISIEVGLMSRAHGSVLFTRGETQALVLAALGSEDDEQMVDGIREEYAKKFMLDYNFPPFSVNETKPPRGPSRRDIGHGALAERSVVPVLPPRDTFPYTIRVLSEIMESNGSSSMASVCGATLSLMDAGVPIRNPVAGIAMGLVSENGRSVVLTDILGSEDHCGDMDFKVAGTQHGITGLQMDIKMEGLPWDVMEKALGQAREGRIKLLKTMLQAIDRPRKELKPHAPRFYRLQINPEKIGKLIGPSGRTIKDIQAQTGAAIEVNDDGIVTIFCADLEKAKKAQDMVETLCQEAKVNQIYEGKIVSIKEFGAFVEILPGTEGLCHISELSKTFVKNVSDVAKMGDMIKVKVIAIDDQGRIKLSHKAILE